MNDLCSKYFGLRISFVFLGVLSLVMILIVSAFMTADNNNTTACVCS